jgi:hypothetical protein
MNNHVFNRRGIKIEHNKAANLSQVNSLLKKVELQEVTTNILI